MKTLGSIAIKQSLPAVRVDLSTSWLFRFSCQPSNNTKNFDSEEWRPLFEVRLCKVRVFYLLRVVSLLPFCFVLDDSGLSDRGARRSLLGVH